MISQIADAPMTKSFGAMSIAQLSSLIQTTAVDPIEVTEAVIDGIEAYADQAAFTAIFKDRATEEAKASSKRMREGRSCGMLDGIPIAWKDLFDIKGRTTTAGSTVLAREPAAQADAPVEVGERPAPQGALLKGDRRQAA